MKPHLKTQVKTLKKPLNIILIILGSSYALLVMFILFVLVTAASRPIGYGDIILFAIPLVLLIGLGSVVYICMVIIYSTKQFKKKKALSKLHISAAIAMLIVGLLPSIGPIRLIYSATLQPSIQILVTSIKDSQFKGPTSTQIAQANLETFEKAQALFDGCNVSSIYYWRFDTDGPFTERNSYLVVSARNNGTIAYEKAPANVRLPITDKEKLKSAMKEYSMGPYPACKLDIEWRDENQFGS